MNEIFNVLVFIWIGVAGIAFLGSVFITAPYGRHTNSKWGILIPNKLGWFIMEFPALLLTPLLFHLLQHEPDNVAIVFVALWMLHYIHRTLIFPLRIQTKGKKMPLAIVVMAIFFNGGNGFFNGYWFGVYADFSTGYLLSVQSICGVLLFIVGMYINISSDYYLIQLRKHSNAGEYQIPQKGMFRFISCPNHFGEMIEWGGFALAVGSLPALSFFIWTVANLLPRALSHHKWYKQKFNEYPENRKAVFPGIL